MHLNRVWRGRGALIIALLLVLALSAAGPGLAQPDDVVSQVGGDAITREAFHARLRFVRWQYVRELTKLYELTGGNLLIAPSYVKSVADSLQQPETLGESVLRQMEQERLLRTEGERLVLAPTADEVQQHEDAFFSRWTNVAVEALPTDPDAQAFIEAWYADALETSGMTRAEIQALFAAEALTTRLYAYVSENVPDEELAVHTRHILCSFQPEAPAEPVAPTSEQRSAAQACVRQAQMRLANGDSFAQIARDLSDDTSAPQGGDVGWVLVSYLADAYAEATADAQLGSVVGPIETEYGLHLIEVLEREMRPLTPDEQTTAQRGYFSIWLDTLYDEADITRAQGWAEGMPVEPGLESLEVTVQAAVERVLARE